MTEERSEYLPMNSPVKLPGEDDEHALARTMHAAYIDLEISNIRCYPATYWPNEWRKRLERLSVCGLALLRLMTDEKEAHELEKRALAAINEVEKAYLDLEAANFPVTDVSPPEQNAGSMKDV